MKYVLILLLLGCVAAVNSSAQNAAPADNPALKKPTKTNPNGISLAELKQLSAARKAAFAANPELFKEEAALQQKIRAFQHEVDQTILQEHPELASFITQAENSPVPRLPMPPPGTFSSSIAAPTPPASSTGR